MTSLLYEKYEYPVAFHSPYQLSPCTLPVMILKTYLSPLDLLLYLFLHLTCHTFLEEVGQERGVEHRV